MSRARAKEATSPQQEMTHNMMTRSKTRAAAAEVEKYKLISYACEFLQRAIIDKHKNRIELWVYMLNLHVKNLV